MSSINPEIQGIPWNAAWNPPPPQSILELSKAQPRCFQDGTSTFQWRSEASYGEKREEKLEATPKSSAEGGGGSSSCGRRQRKRDSPWQEPHPHPPPKHKVRTRTPPRHPLELWILLVPFPAFQVGIALLRAQTRIKQDPGIFIIPIKRSF